MDEKKTYTAEEAENIGREIYDGLLTIPEAAEKYKVDYYVARRYYRDYRTRHGLPPKMRPQQGTSAPSEKPRDIGELEEMTKEQLIDEVIRARADAERAKKGYEVRGGGAEKEFASISDASSK